MKIVNKVWGRELWIANNEKYCGKILELDTGYRCSMHYHKNKDETFYISKGRVLMEIEDKIRIMEPGHIQRIFPGQKHRFTGIAPVFEDDVDGEYSYSEIYEISTHHKESDSYRDLDKLSGEVDLDELQVEIGIAFK